MEIWQDIPEYEGRYQVSSLGRIKLMSRTFYTAKGALATSKERINNKRPDRDGYISLLLCKDYKKVNIRVHTLVAKAFIPNPENKKCVNHINGIKHDNRVENLEWCTYSENNKHMYKIGLAKVVKSWQGRINSPDRSKKVDQFLIDGTLVKTWPSIAEIRRELGLYPNNIWNCIKGRYAQAYGYVWKYRD